MNLAIEDDRLAHLLMRGDGQAGYDEARRKLDRAALVLTADAAAGLPWGQAALLTAAECGVRMFPGGVYLGSDFGDTTVVGQFGRWPIRRHLELAGCGTTNAPAHATTSTSAPSAGACNAARYAGPTAGRVSSASRRRPISLATATKSPAC